MFRCGVPPTTKHWERLSAFPEKSYCGKLFNAVGSHTSPADPVFCARSGACDAGLPAKGARYSASTCSRKARFRAAGAV